MQRNLSNSLTKKSKVQGRSELAASSSIRVPQPIVNIPYRLEQSLSPLVPNMNCRFIITNGNSVQAMNSVGEKQVTSEQIPSELKCKVGKSATKQIEARSKVDQCPELKGNKDVSIFLFVKTVLQQCLFAFNRAQFSFPQMPNLTICESNYFLYAFWEI